MRKYQILSEINFNNFRDDISYVYDKIHFPINREPIRTDVN